MKSKKTGLIFSQEHVDFIITNYEKMQIMDLVLSLNHTFQCNFSVLQVKRKIKQLKITKRNIQENYGKYTPEMIEWLKTNFEKMKLDDLVAAFNEYFNTTFTKSALWHKTNRFLDGQITRVNKYIPRTKWTDEMINWLKENYNKYSYKKTSELINKIFNVKTTTSSVEHKVNRLGLKKDKEGLRASYNLRKASKFWFKPGRISPTKKPIGYERLDKKTGIIWIKTQDPDIFEAKHRVIYREHYGEIKEGMNIVFLNGNKQDYRIENLVALTNQELALFNTLQIRAKGIDEIGKVKLAITKNKSI